MVAVTVHVYVFALVRPVTVIGEAVRVTVRGVPPSLEVHTAV